MKATGIIRRVDELGRIVIPKEIRRTLRIREADPLEIFTDRDGEIILKKYSPIGELSNTAQEMAEALAQVTGELVCICDQDQVVAAAGSESKKYMNKSITADVENQIQNRESVCGSGARIKVMDEDEHTSIALAPIICSGDAIGAVAIIGKKERSVMGEQELKLATVAAQYLGKNLED